MEKKKYPIGPEYYTLHEEVGQGVSASVHRAVCIPFNEIVAIKILDFERDNCDLNNISREAQTMILVDHPNVLKSHCSFVSDHNLWVVMPYMAGGSCLHILKAAYPDGFEEVVIATVLREVLKGLEYLHHHGHIHRDVKAGNILIDSRGAIKLGDFGVSACIFDSGDRQRMRNTFVGTPCWMAPEVMEQLHGYDFKADIWSFGITALELAHGHAPFSKYPPMKVLLMTLQNAPPGLDYERDRKFSKSFKQMIASCLVKDPLKRPSAKKLLKHSFFKQARSNDYIARTLLDGLPALGDRIQALKRKEEDMLAQKKMPDGEKEELSQNEYKRGISGWNFNLEDMKAQASLIQDEDLVSDTNQGGSSSSLSTLDGQDKQSECQTSSQPLDKEDNDPVQNQPTPVAAVEPTINIAKVRFERSDDDSSVASPSHEHHAISPHHEDHVESNLGEKSVLEINGKSSDNMSKPFYQRTTSFSGSTSIPETIVPPIKGESDKQNQPQNIFVGNGAAVPAGGEDSISDLHSKASKSSAVNSDDLDEKAKPPVVQQRGRFKVTSENVDLEKVAPAPILQKSHSMQVGTLEVLTPHPVVSLAPPPSDAASSTLAAHHLFPLLQSVLQTNILQRENILNLIKHISAVDSTVNRAFEGVCTPANVAVTEKSLLEAAHDRERELLHEITELQWRLICAQEELQKYKTENAQV
ncbi:PREDICTED: serine/threonine-protein kinase BLUS1 isoform X1 [Theobroma cacao]|uniref:Serine/threonine-protein kinase BLUS1 isoform X1 n=1 Tax=Theobroma cacao TaxID=3641 RepID=A0AB32WKZ3_THECC|nr:PREDICTED: serine/threonine-protein kinase BLUS1 isoform X1 [Theobroma cacao]XP_017978612.1 PREDICTED: serine/threonine-protein kinase BLUS1 isoform X1 [Theobroma cacao]XP_017978613.1 PREDICTED: serine/threonine-protein kinase BLUS1 isoform X1 [Theobroma cacao]XP_017978614.1 PREDICTED: serine/threonine-protein kinase BLUS1 isoform X1 [Theobroma cacao]XP_017978615.1 PREDICTED: serine/threonine-protein kinase BLUS1 isoform X1 [Theobroma cacao]XP_017978616.1 PREDICTED: serine/threonine-protein